MSHSGTFEPDEVAELKEDPLIEIEAQSPAPDTEACDECEYVIFHIEPGFDKYQKLTRETAIYPTGEDVHGVDIGLLYALMGLAGEAGELSNDAKKVIREDDEDYLESLPDELGDVLWYLARVADELDVSLDKIAEENLSKLYDRQARNVLTGEGDAR